MVTKKKNFAQVTENALRRPTSMQDFLANDDSEAKDLAEGKGRAPDNEAPQIRSESKSPNESQAAIASSQITTDNSSNLSEQTTLYLDLQVCEILDALWLKLRQKAPKGKKKRISKSLIVNRMVEFCNAGLEKDGLDNNELVEMILTE